MTVVQMVKGARINQVSEAVMTTHIEMSFVTFEDVKITPEGLGTIEVSYHRNGSLVFVKYTADQYGIKHVSESPFEEYQECVEHGEYPLNGEMIEGRKFVTLYLELKEKYLFAADTKHEYETQDWFDCSCEKHYRTFKNPLVQFIDTWVGELEIEGNETVAYKSEKLGNTHFKASFEFNTGFLSHALVIDYLAIETNDQSEQEKLAKMLLVDSYVQAGATTEQLANYETNLTLISVEKQ
ncbi:hypothetical protein ACI2JA_19790 [Alkalihalobacillus sp. NPDC078783]|uniref:hypothetical protein n=1 Tax=Streptomyces albidoflavus TaxID=1886 RepID=UPI0033F54D46